jgi:hypothetical protein
MDLAKLINKDEYSLSVSPKQLSEKTIEIKKICDDILMHMKNVEGFVNKTQYCWNSESYELLLSIFNEDKDEIQDIKARLNRQIKNLNSIISLYIKSENEAVDDIERLPSGIIE